MEINVRDSAQHDIEYIRMGTMHANGRHNGPCGNSNTSRKTRSRVQALAWGCVMEVLFGWSTWFIEAPNRLPVGTFPSQLGWAACWSESSWADGIVVESTRTRIGRFKWTLMLLNPGSEVVQSSVRRKLQIPTQQNTIPNATPSLRRSIHISSSIRADRVCKRSANAIAPCELCRRGALPSERDKRLWDHIKSHTLSGKMVP